MIFRKKKKTNMSDRHLLRQAFYWNFNFDQGYTTVSWVLSAFPIDAKQRQPT
jgi:hypothetical protein